jgi:hypothetical protein
MYISIPYHPKGKKNFLPNTLIAYFSFLLRPFHLEANMYILERSKIPNLSSPHILQHADGSSIQSASKQGNRVVTECEASVSSKKETRLTNKKEIRGRGD